MRISDSEGGGTAPTWQDTIVNPRKTTKTSLLPFNGSGQPFGYTPVSNPVVQPRPLPVAPQPSATGQYGGGGGGNYGGGGGYAAPSMAADIPVASPPIPSPEDYLTKDDMYQALLRRYNQNETQFRANMDKTNSLLDTNAVEQKSGLNKQQGVDLNDLLQNYAGRGVVFSSGYGNNVNDVANAYAQRLAAVDQNVTRGHDEQAQALADFLQNKQSDIEQARADALARRLAQYGV